MPLFCIVAHDKPDADAPARRQAARVAHFHRTSLAVQRGQVHFAGSMLGEDGTMRTSVLIVDFPDRAALDAWIADEPYKLNGAWDRIEVAPLFVAVQEGRITADWLRLMTPLLDATGAPAADRPA
jgi:uncharacterized protein YciI